MTTTVIDYLHDVLGMDYLPLKGAAEGQTKVEALRTKKVLVVVSQPFGPSDQELLARMMNAVQIDDYMVSSEMTDGPAVILVLCAEVAAQQGLKNHGETLTVGGRRLMYSHSLADLRTGSASEIHQRKKQTWTHLQTMQMWLQEQQ